MYTHQHVHIRNTETCVFRWSNGR